MYCVNYAGPIGGSGGGGGSVILEVNSKLNTLLKFKGIANFRAENGMPGECNFLNGRYGDDCIVSVPPGTIIRDADSLKLIGELKNEKDRLVVAKGGLGGQGNGASKATRGGKAICTPPTGGERRNLKLELKLVADIGLVGVPNAGKSTLLDAITNARPKIAAYPFTTIVPNLGVCEVDRFHTEQRIYHEATSIDEGNEPGGLTSSSGGTAGQTMVVADIPGLLDGAHLGVGLGRAFLRHIERCKTIIHVIDGDAEDPVRNYLAINNELQLYSPVLANKPQIVVLNKVDLPSVAERLPELTTRLKGVMPHSRLLTISAAGRVGVADLVAKSWQFLQKIREAEQEPNENALQNLDPRESTM